MVGLYVDAGCDDTAARSFSSSRHEHAFPHLRRVGAALGALVLLLGSTPAVAQVDRTLRLEAIETIPPDAGLAAALGDLLDLHPGDALTADDLVTARRDVARTGWFERVEVYTRPGSVRGRVVLRVEGTLDDGLNFETGVGHDPLEGWYLNLVGASMRHQMGAGSTLRANVQFGERRQMLRFEAEAPRVGGGPIDLLFDAGNGVEDWFAYDGDVRFEQDVERSHYRFGARWRVGRAVSSTLWIGESRHEPQPVVIEPIDGGPEPASLFGAFDGEERQVDFRLDLTLDRRDRVQPWRRGAWTLLRADASIPRDDRPAFARARAAFRGALPLPQNQALALRLGRDVDRPRHALPPATDLRRPGQRTRLPRREPERRPRRARDRRRRPRVARADPAAPRRRRAPARRVLCRHRPRRRARR